MAQQQPPRVRPAAFVKQGDFDDMVEQLSGIIADLAARVDVLTHLVVRVAEDLDSISEALFGEDEPDTGGEVTVEREPVDQPEEREDGI
jgi:hypothetical protein